MVEYDLVVAGGGPSGSAAAITAAKRGLRVLLLEAGGHHRRKPCGGLLPPLAEELISDVFGEGIPDSVRSCPRSLGLFYVPPSGIGSGERVRGYRLSSVDREPLDEWMRSMAGEAGAEVCYSSSLRGFSYGGHLSVELQRSGDREVTEAHYLVGADGAFSRVRSILGLPSRLLRVTQESWTGDGIGDDFHIIFNGTLTDSYGYAIPKRGRVEIGLGPLRGAATSEDNMAKFRGILERDFGLRLGAVSRRESWAIPNGSVQQGRSRVLLVGDAGGFCNPLSGEGIRLGVESGEAAGKSVSDAVEGEGAALSAYKAETEQLRRLVESIYDFSSALDDHGREDFVAQELARWGPS